MESGKRRRQPDVGASSSELQSDRSLKKKQLSDRASDEQNNDTEETDITILQFQKRAMSNRLKQKNSEIELLKHEVASMRAGRKDLELVSGLIASKWQQLICDLEVLCLQTNVDAASIQAETAKPEPTSADPFVSYLESFVADSDQVMEQDIKVDPSATADSGSLSENLERKVANAKAVVASLVDRMRYIQSHTGLQGTGPSVTFAPLALKFRSASEKAEAQAAVAASLRAQVQDLRNRTETDSQTILNLQRKCARLENAGEEAAASAAAAAAAARDVAASSSTGDATPNQMGSAAGAIDSEARDETIDALRQEIADLQSLLQSKETTEEELRRENIDAKSMVQQLCSRSLPDESVVKLPQYRALQFSLTELQRDVNEKSSAIARLQSQSSQWQQLLNQERAAFEAERLQERNRRQSEVLKLSQVNEELSRNVQVMQSQVDSSTVSDHKKMESLIKDLGTVNAEQYQELQTLRESLREAGVEHYNVRELMRRYKKEKKEWEEKERDLRTLIDTYKTTSKETRQLADIRMAEAQVRKDNIALRTELEILRQSDSSKQISELKAKLDKQGEELETQQEINSALMSELEEMAKLCEAKEQQNSILVQQTTSSQNLHSMMVAERLKHVQARNAWISEREKWNQKLQVAAESDQVRRTLIDELEARIETLQKGLSKREEELRAYHQVKETLSAEVARFKERAVLATQQLEEANALLDQSQTSFKNEMERTHAIDASFRKLSAKHNMVQRKLERLTTQSDMNGSDDASGLQQELQFLKRKLKCSVCSDRDKNCVLTKCGHMFCKECIDERMRVRLRKCPGCAVQIGADDIKVVWF